MINRIAILGTGLIGGSLGLAWHRRRPDITIVGHDRPDVLERAEEREALDAKAATPETAVEEADLVVLATPLATTLRLLDTIAEHLPEGCLVTDVASVKQPVLDQARDVLPEHVSFLGGHPMAGSEQSGIDHADPLLFENAVYALSLPDATDEAVLDDGPFAPIVDLVEATGARPLVLEASRHDRLVAAISHVPQLLAVALVTLVAETEDEDSDLALQLAGGGFRDMTRIADSPFEMWRDVLVGNEGAIHDALSRFRRLLRRLRNRLIEEDLDALEDLFETARTARASIPRDSKGFLHPLSDLYVRAPDEPGIIHDITGHLLEADLNIKDIELQQIREGTGGTFRLSFDEGAEAEEAVALLTEAGYEAWRP